jgi:hypothetical protein
MTDDIFRQGRPTIAYHYTIAPRFRQIITSGFLNTTDAGITGEQKPVLWFSTNPIFEPTASERIEIPDLGVRILTPDESRGLFGGLFRFGLGVEHLIPWDRLHKAALMQPETVSHLEFGGRIQGADPGAWFGSLEPISVRDIATIDELDSDGKWVNIGGNRARLQDELTDWLAARPRTAGKVQQ